MFVSMHDVNKILVGNMSDLNKILEAHNAITRIKGKEYAPTAAEIQEWINNKSNEKVF